jgi:aspartyl-tRNA(Asn)/glutamyl-tRNA(Gln) amidotransferase subunit A
MTNDDGPLTITAAAPLIRDGVLTPSALLEQCLARIDRYEPRVRAWAYLDRERARREAEQLTGELKRGHHRGPLHGIPVGVKDIVDVFDMPTGCGSKLWANSYARRDATVVERLRQAGALVLGKTVTTPYAFLDPPPTRNPWNVERTPGGSSSGSAAAVTCGMCLAALGTQTGGSVTRPASYCGVCSLKPTWGRVSVDGVLPLAPSLDHVGVMANCVRDLAAVFQVIAGEDQRDLTSSARPVPDCLRRIEQAIVLPDSPEESRRLFRPGVCIPASYYEAMVTPAVAEFMRRVGNDFASLAHLDGFYQYIVLPAGFAEIHRRHRTIMAVEAAEQHGERLRRHPDDYPPRIRELVEEGSRIAATEYREARLFRDDLDAQFEDLAWPEPILMPATLDVAPSPDTTGNPWCNSPWSFLGVPTVSLPLGWSGDGLPMAVQFVGAPWHEDSLFATAARVEHVFRTETNYLPHRLPPVS